MKDTSSFTIIYVKDDEDNFWIVAGVIFDGVGFQLPWQSSNLVLWDEVIRVARCFRPDFYTIDDWDYWTFQTKDSNLYVWVQIDTLKENWDFSEEVYKRFGKTDIPPVKDWMDKNVYAQTFIIYPKEEIGRPLYVWKKKHWWSLNVTMEYLQA